MDCNPCVVLFILCFFYCFLFFVFVYCVMNCECAMRYIALYKTQLKMHSMYNVGHMRVCVCMLFVFDSAMCQFSRLFTCQTRYYELDCQTVVVWWGLRRWRQGAPIIHTTGQKVGNSTPSRHPSIAVCGSFALSHISFLSMQLQNLFVLEATSYIRSIVTLHDHFHFKIHTICVVAGAVIKCTRCTWGTHERTWFIVSLQLFYSILQ